MLLVQTGQALSVCLSLRRDLGPAAGVGACGKPHGLSEGQKHRVVAITNHPEVAQSEHRRCGSPARVSWGFATQLSLATTDYLPVILAFQSVTESAIDRIVLMRNYHTHFGLTNK